MSHTESMGAIFSAYLRDNEYLGSMQSCHHPSLVLELSPFRTSWWTSHPSRTPISPTPGHLAHMASPSLGCQQEGYRPLFTVETRLPFMFKVKAQCWARLAPVSPLCHLTIRMGHFRGHILKSPRVCMSPSTGLTLLALLCQANSYIHTSGPCGGSPPFLRSMNTLDGADFFLFWAHVVLCPCASVTMCPVTSLSPYFCVLPSSEGKTSPDSWWSLSAW